MAKILSPAARALLRKLRNPYATEQIEDSIAESRNDAQVEAANDCVRLTGRLEERKTSRNWLMQDPYASLDELTQNRPTPALRLVERPKCSRMAFRRGCTKVFRYYTPEPERGKRSALREEHLAFIARNENRSPEIRHALLQELQRFDLSRLAGIQPQLNLEKDALTEEKLRQIEQKIIGD